MSDTFGLIETAVASPDLPWTLYAWEATMGRYNDLPSWVTRQAQQSPPPPTAIYADASGDWHTLADIRNERAQDIIKAYASAHGHVIPQSVIDVWETQAETKRLIEAVTEHARHLATTMAPAMRDEAELMRWVGHHMVDLAYEKGVGA